jgi:predicted Zn-dependent protease
MRLVSFLLLSLLLCSCSNQKLEQDGGNLTRGEVEFLSSRMREAVEAEYPLLKHKLVTRYVNDLGQSIVSRNPDMPPLPYEFRVLRSNDIFVFSLPGGIVYVTLGTLRAMSLEGQLAAALAHELAHQQLGHPLILWRRKVNNRRGKNLVDFSGPFNAVFLGDAGALRMEPGMEEEADRVAPVLLYHAGFDPRLYLSYLQVLRKLEASSAPSVAALLSLHPPLKERMNWVKDSLVKIPPRKDASVSSATFTQIKSILDQAARKGKTDRKSDDEN